VGEEFGRAKMVMVKVRTTKRMERNFILVDCVSDVKANVLKSVRKSVFPEVRSF